MTDELKLKTQEFFNGLSLSEMDDVISYGRDVCRDKEKYKREIDGLEKNISLVGKCYKKTEYGTQYQRVVSALAANECNVTVFRFSPKDKVEHYPLTYSKTAQNVNFTPFEFENWCYTSLREKSRWVEIGEDEFFEAFESYKKDIEDNLRHNRYNRVDTDYIADLRRRFLD